MASDIRIVKFYMSINANFLKTYADKTYKHTAMVRHKGKVVALGMDDQRHIYYSVLNLDNSDSAKSPLDVHYWLENPKVIRFSNEIVQVGYGIVDPVKMPIVKKGSRTEAEAGTLRPEEIDPFLSTTARFTADAPCDALSDGKYIYIFRQSINPDHQDMVYARNRDGSPVLDGDGNKVPLVNDTLLVDRFVLAGTELLAKREVRYKRSRNKYRSQSNKDSLGAQDMEKKPFYEPTQELDFVGNLRDGRFSVLLLPTQIAGIQRWQVFTHNSQTGRIDSFNVERSANLLFNTKGTQFYTSPDPQYQKSVFERQPGTCPFTGQDLIPLGDESGIHRSSFELNGRTIESGISAILYYQQENAATGYDQQEKPIKKNARVMVAVGSAEEQNSSGKNHIGVLDLAVSREGKLGQIPDNITLPLLSNPDIESGSSNESLDQISNIEKKITRLQGEIKQLENSNQQSTAKIPGIDLEISKLDQQIKNLQQELSKTKNLRYQVKTYTGDVSSAGTDANVYVTLKGSLKDSREFEIDNSSNNFERGDWDDFGPFDLGEIGSLKQVRIRHDDSGAGSGWYLGKVVIDVYQGSNVLESLEFRCMSWLEDSSLSRTLSPNSSSSLRDRVQIQNDINRKSNEQNNLRNKKNELSSLKDGQQLSKADKQKELSEQQKILTVLKAQQGDAVPLPMSILHIDPLGLTLSGGLLNFAQTQDTPQLFDSATGKLALYYRGVDDQLFAAYYDTHTQKSQSLLPAETGNLTLSARSAEPELDESSITVSDGATPETCTVIIQNTATDITETWNNVPRDVEEFSNVLNGTANEKILIGSLAKDMFGIVTTLTLEKPVKYPLNSGDILLVGQTQVQVDAAVERNATTIGIVSATVETAINTSVYLVPYDYPAQTNTNKTTYSLQQGSLHFLAFPGNAKGKVKNGTATSNGITISCQWIPQSPGKALAFDGQDDYVGLQQPSDLANQQTEPSGFMLSALEFDGQDDYVNIGNPSALHFSGAAPYTIEAWIAPEETGSNMSLVTKWNRGVGGAYWFRLDANKKLAVNHNVAPWTIQSSDTVETGKFSHVALTYDSSVIRFYINGKPAGSGNLGGSTDNTTNVLIGAAHNFGNPFEFFKGKIAEVRIWDRARTQAEIEADLNQPLKGDESGLVGYWRFEEGIAKDYSGNGYDGTYHGHPKRVDSAPLKLPASSELTSTSTSALQFDGSGDYVEIQNYKGVTGKNSRTVEAWIKTTSTHQTIVSWGANNPSQKWVFRVQIDKGKPNTIRAEVNGGYIIGSTPVNDGQWHHVACTLENDGSPNVTDVKLYVDGQLETISAKASCAINTAASRNVFIGNDFISRYFNGAIDEVRIWDRVRTQAEIQADMDQPLQGNESGLVGYWRFEEGVAKDYSGNGHDGTYHGNPKLVDSAPVKLPTPPVEVDQPKSVEVDASEIIDFPTQLARSDADGDLTLEAWVNPSAVTDITRVIHHYSPNSQYTLGLKPEGDGYSCFMGVGSQFKQSLESFKLGQWEHLAVVYGQSYGLQFNGSAYLSCDHNPTLDVTQDLTIEAFLQVDDLQQPQGILSKGQLDNGGEESVPYGLYIDTDGKIAFAFEDKEGNNYVYKSTQSLSAGQFYKIAVTRFEQTEVKDEGSSRSPNVKVNQWSDIRFYINQQEAGYHKYEGQDPGSNSQPLEIGKTYQGSQENYLKGILSELRLYNTALNLENLGSKIHGNEEGLIGWWRFEENEGNIAYDFKSSNHAIIKGAKWVKNPDPKGSTLLFYRNGSAVEIEEMSQELQWGEEQFTLGANKNGNLQECFAGTMEEVRIWKVARTQEQIQDNLFTRLKGDKQDLIANYTFDGDSELESETELQDHSLLGNHLILGSGDSKPTPVISTAPISDDIAQVRSALGGVKTQFHDIIHSRPAIQEYGDLQYDIDGNLMGVHKRCYGYIKNDQWHLLTGYKVGNLMTEWIGQVQADPQIIGYIEGAPPVPSENLTGTSMKLGEFEDYNGCSTVELEEADSVNYIYAASKEDGFDTAIETTFALGFKSETLAGIGVATTVSDVQSAVGVKNTLEYSNSQLSESSVSYGRNTTKTSRLELRGSWEQAGSEINSAVGRRFVPANTGFALVQSDTMDVFALRLAHNNALVSYQMQPNPDIPKDWNIITFPLNNTYTKQGTLDGKVGVKEDGSVQCDPDYGNATTYGQYSYFKPIEAYGLKNKIEREQQELQTYYQSYNIDAGDDTTSMDIPKSLASRNLVNTYVWTADGGFFSESTEVMESTQESTTGSYSFQGMGGVATDINTAISGVAVHFEMDALFGGHVETIKTKGKETEKSFGLTVEVEPEVDIQLYVNTDAERDKYKGCINEGGGAYDEQGNPILRPGKVDAYRFMSFYLEPTKDNFEDFFNKVVDPIWLEQSDAPNAVALRQANQGDKKPKCWRIMHRVTFVSRVLPEIEAPNAPPMEKAIRKVNIESNYELIKKLEPFVKNKTQDAAIFADAVRNTLKTYLPELQPFEADIIEYAALYFGVSQG